MSPSLSYHNRVTRFKVRKATVAFRFQTPAGEIRIFGDRTQRLHNVSVSLLDPCPQPRSVFHQTSRKRYGHIAFWLERVRQRRAQQRAVFCVRRVATDVDPGLGLQIVEIEDLDGRAPK